MKKSKYQSGWNTEDEIKKKLNWRQTKLISNERQPQDFGGDLHMHTTPTTLISPFGPEFTVLSK